MIRITIDDGIRPTVIEAEAVWVDHDSQSTVIVLGAPDWPAVATRWASADVPWSAPLHQPEHIP